MSLELFAAIGWYLFVISPILWRFVFNYLDEKYEE